MLKEYLEIYNSKIYCSPIHSTMDFFTLYIEQIEGPSAEIKLKMPSMELIRISGLWDKDNLDKIKKYINNNKDDLISFAKEIKK